MLTWTPPGVQSWFNQVGTDVIRTQRNIRLGLVGLNVLVAAICAVMLWSAWRANIQTAETRVTNAARLMEQSVSAMLDKSAIVLEATGSQIERQMQGDHLSPASVNGLISAQADQIPELTRIAVFDAKGSQMCIPPLSHCNPINVADRDYFLRLRKAPGDPIKLDGPYTSRIDTQRTLALTRPLRGSHGQFAGVISGAVPLNGLQTLVDMPDLGPEGSASLRLTNLDLLVRHPIPPQANASSSRMAVPRALMAAVSRAPAEGIYRAKASIDGIDRVMAYKRLPNYPLYVLIGIAADDFLASWRTQVAWTIGFLILFAAVSWQMAHATSVSLRRQVMVQKLYDEAPCGYHTLNEQGLYLSINATELSWLGCTEAQVIRKRRPSDFFSVESQATFAENFPKFRRTGHIENLELDLISQDGQVRRVLVNAKAMIDPRTGFWMSNSVMHDITALHQARQQLQVLTREQSLMLNNDLVGIIKVKDRQIIWANHGMERLFGYARDEWPNMPTQQLYVDEATYARVGLESLAAMKDGHAYRTQLQMLRQDGSTIWIDVSGEYLSEETGELMLLLADITPLKLMEEARVLTVKLDAQNVQLKETSRLQNEFLSNLSHELRTPLNAIIGFSQLLKAGTVKPDSPMYPTYIQQIGSSGQHLLRLIETMLDYASVEAGKMTFSAVLTQVAQTLQDVIDLSQPQRMQKQLTLVLEVDPDMPEILTDPGRLKQMAMSLLDNAIKFSHPGGKITIRAQLVDDDFWTLQVEDHGIGIAKADLPKLFSPFVQLSSGATKSYGGTGLGLTLLRRLVMAQGGKVEVSSEPGHGSTFTLTLPRILKTGSNAHPS